MQVRATDVANEERVAGEDEPGLFRAPAPVGDDVGVVCGRVPGRRERPHDRVPELDHLTVTERDDVEVDRRARREVRRRARLDERRQPGDVIGLHVRLEDGTDRRTEAPCLFEVLVDELGVRIDDRELVVRQAAEQVARARCGGKEKRPQDHACLTVRRVPSIEQGESSDTAHRRGRYIALAPLGHDTPSPPRRDRAAGHRLGRRAEPSESASRPRASTCACSRRLPGSDWSSATAAAAASPRRAACSPHGRARHSRRCTPVRRSWARLPVSRRERSTSAPRRRRASTCSRTRSAAFGATTRTSTSKSRSPRRTR